MQCAAIPLQSVGVSRPSTQFKKKTAFDEKKSGLHFVNWGQASTPIQQAMLYKCIIIGIIKFIKPHDYFIIENPQFVLYCN